MTASLKSEHDDSVMYCLLGNHKILHNLHASKTPKSISLLNFHILSGLRIRVHKLNITHDHECLYVECDCTVIVCMLEHIQKGILLFKGVYFKKAVCKTMEGFSGLF